MRDVRDAVHAGKRMRELVEDDDLIEPALKYHRAASFLLSLAIRRRPVLPNIVFLYGPPGCGKTYEVIQKDDVWATPLGKSFWFDGYCDHTNCLIDEYSGQFPLRDYLRLTDAYSIKVPIKGDFVWFEPESIWITSNVHPFRWYDWTEKHGDRRVQFLALYRRFTTIIHWDSSGSRRTELHRPVGFKPGDGGVFEEFFTEYAGAEQRGRGERVELGPMDLWVEQPTRVGWEWQYDYAYQ